MTEKILKIVKNVAVVSYRNNENDVLQKPYTTIIIGKRELFVDESDLRKKFIDEEGAFVPVVSHNIENISKCDDCWDIGDNSILWLLPDEIVSFIDDQLPEMKKSLMSHYESKQK